MVKGLVSFLVFAVSSFFLASARAEAQEKWLAEVALTKVRTGAIAFSQLTKEELDAIKARDGAATIRDRTGATVFDGPPPPPPTERTGTTIQAPTTTSPNTRGGV